MFAASVAASLAAHLYALLAFTVVPTPESAPVEPLRVTLEKREPPRVLPAAPPEPPRVLPAAPPEPPPPPPRVTRPRPPAPVRKEQPAIPERPLPPEAPAPTRQLVLEPGPSEPAFTVPAEPRPAPVAPPRETAAAAKVEAPPVEKSAPVTPPSFNAAYLRNPAPRYPLSARRAGEQGTVVLRVYVTREGVPENVSVHATSGHRSLDHAAIEAVKSWRFAPARQGTQAVGDWVLVPIVFKLEGTS